MLRKLFCRVFGHKYEKLVEFTESDEFGAHGIKECRRCSLRTPWALLTLKGFDREVKRSYTQGIRGQINAESPLIRLMREKLE